mmetsp:Transcript_39931/g.118455  ORF Transcript_39931/g.118455 Transcript_39931/m.118455 type:complete len:229 (+) Transcript_39931:1323-2009(+)
MAASESSTNPDSLSVSVWMVACTSCSSQKVRQVSIAAGVVPQSSCSLKPAAPAWITSSIPCGSDVFPLPEKPKLSGSESVARSIVSTWLGAGVQVVAQVPAAGPVPPPYIVVMPDAIASSAICGQIQCTCVSMAPAVTIIFSPAMASVVTPVVMPGVTPSIVSGLPALPMPTMRDPLIPMSALTTPSAASMMSAFVMTTSSASAGAPPDFWPIPSRSTLPPPNLTSSP